MSLSWIDKYITGIIEYCNSRDIYEIYNSLNINIIKTIKNDPLLGNNEALYIRNFNGIEVVFINNDLPYEYQKFVLAHELGHAVLHTEIQTAAFNKDFINKAKLERQANYFALKLLNIKIDPVEFRDYTIDYISKSLYVSEESLSYLYLSNI